ncbi:MAG: hypothetical protein HW381_173, partial [Candidatus Rokubacteria bacterium]|nr:hypothetical protein [Candidatus Rokubacteria bacterium]
PWLPHTVVGISGMGSVMALLPRGPR